MNNSLLTILLLILFNTFMTFAWYGHLKFKELNWFSSLGLMSIILISWGIAFLSMFFWFRPTGWAMLKMAVHSICGN